MVLSVGIDALSFDQIYSHQKKTILLLEIQKAG